MGDFSKTFDWNTHSVFMYLTAEYSTQERPRNEVVVWDHIMLREDDQYTINVKNQRYEYPLYDYKNGLVGNENVTLQMHYNIIPVAGLLPLIRSGPTKTL